MRRRPLSSWVFTPAGSFTQIVARSPASAAITRAVATDESQTGWPARPADAAATALNPKADSRAKNGLRICLARSRRGSHSAPTRTSLRSGILHVTQSHTAMNP